ncbi:nucleoside phosphorylase domain-containing protein [Annulohypoxylon bovei var. microspora]|nr:nucleoside phosphorylase domain-containing protein [Annulohypoxylon bovei var. microspora]
MQSNSRSHDDYTVAIICAISFEMSAVRYMLEKEHPSLESEPEDSNSYVFGTLSGHNVVLACLPGTQGKCAAATVAANLTRTFRRIQWRLFVGIGGGVPTRHDIRLGDVVVSMPEGQYGGVVQYDLGKDTTDNFILKGFSWPPPADLRSAIELMRSDHRVKENKINGFISTMVRKEQSLAVYKRPRAGSDVLFKADYPHNSTYASCESCHRSKIVRRVPRESEAPQIHYGLIASGDSVLKSAVKRDAAVRNLGDILCFEMEAAGLMTEFTGITIRGISDYGDSHKNDGWHYYAAAAAAAYAKELLSYLAPKNAPRNK